MKKNKTKPSLPPGYASRRPQVTRPPLAPELQQASPPPGQPLDAAGHPLYDVGGMNRILRGELALTLGMQGIAVPELGDLGGHITTPPLI